MHTKIIPSSFPVGTEFSRLTTITLPFKRHRSCGLDDWYVTCRCSCGNIKDYILYPLRKGTTRSCGCLRTEVATERCIARRVIDGHADARLREVWYGMRRRCRDPKHDSFRRYGARGIKVCEAWSGSYPAFREWAVNHPAYRDGLSIERLDNDKDYEPGNCTWIPLPQQALNRSTTKYHEYQGESKLLWEWAADPRCLAPSVYCLYERLAKGWTFERALTTPAQRYEGRAAKLTEDQVREIRAAHATGKFLHREIGAMYGVGANTISVIVNRKTWTHVE